MNIQHLMIWALALSEESLNYSQLGINTDICNILARITISGVQSKVLWTRGHVAIRVTRGGVWELLYRVLHIVLYSTMQMQTLL